MRNLTAGGLAVAALLSLAACGGSGDMSSKPALDPGDVRELTGLSAPVETAQAQRQRQLEILARADSLIASTMHVEAAFPNETRAITLLTECAGAGCTVLNPVTGATETASLDTLEVATGDPQPVGSAHGVTLMSETGHHEGVDLTSLGAWMEHGGFVLNDQRWAEEGSENSALYTMAMGDLTDRPLTGSATWLGIMAGTPVAGDEKGDRLVGTAALNYDLGAGGLDAAFSGIKNVDRGTAHGIETVIFADLAVGPDGTFARGQSGARIQGGFYGPDHVEAAGIFEQSGIVGGFAAKRQ